MASNAVLCLPGPQFPHQCRSRLSRRTRPALRQRDSLWQNLGAARIAAQASGCRLGHRHPASGAVLPAGGCRLGSRLQTCSKKAGTRPPAGSGTARPRPRSRRPCGSRGLSSALRLPRSLLPPPSLACSLPPPGRLGADSAARCSRGWKMAGNDCGALLDEELSSFFLNYLADTQVRPAGAAGPEPGVLSCRGCRRSRGGWEAVVGASRGSGVPGCRAPPSMHPAIRSVKGAGSWRSPAQAGAFWAVRPPGRF